MMGTSLRKHVDERSVRPAMKSTGRDRSPCARAAVRRMRGAPLAVHLLSLGFLLGIVSPGCREGSGFSALRKSRDVAEKYLELLKKQDYESAIALTTPRL